MKKSIVLIAAVALFSLMASAKSYDITLTGRTLVGTVQLAAGEYSVKLVGNNAVFTNQNTLKTYTAPVKIEQAPKKFDQTAVDTKQQNGEDYIQKIELGGSTTELEFGE
jgi:hypothetical protein